MRKQQFLNEVYDIAEDILQSATPPENLPIPATNHESLTFDDVTIIPTALTRVSSRKDVNPTVTFTDINNEMLKMFPLFGASMDFMWEQVAESLHKVDAVHILPRVGRDQQQRIQAAHNLANRGIRFGMALGLNDSAEFVSELLKVGGSHLKFLSIDVAHGASIGMAEYLYDFYTIFGINTGIILGNIGSWEGATFLIRTAQLLAMDSVILKVGIGPGSACTTRVKTGVGLGQMSALSNVYAAIEEEAETVNVDIIADGGITKPGDFVKALALADAVMVGRYLTSEDFSGEITVKDGKKFFTYYGMASKRAKGNADEYVEGDVVTTEIQFQSSADAVKSLDYGLRSAMTYVNAKDLQQFRKNVRFARTTPASTWEGGVHK